MRQITDSLGALAVMRRSGLLHFPRIDRSLATMAAARKYGPFAGAVHSHASRGLDATAISDERGDVTYIELDAASNALVRAWKSDGLTPGSIVGVMARNHRGLVLTMVAAAKLGARLVMMNTGFAPRQLVEVAVREKVSAFVFDSEFAAVAAALPADVRRYLSWQDNPVQGIPTLDSAAAGFDRSAVPPPESFGGFVLLTSGTTGTPKGAPRARTSPLASAQFVDRVPLREGQTMVMAAPAFHGTGVSQLALALALGQTVVMVRRFSPIDTLRAIEAHRGNVLVVVPTMLQRILALGAATIAEFDTSSLRIIFSAGAALSPDI